MGFLGSVTHGAGRVVSATTSIAGAAGGAFVGGAVGAVRGAVRGAGTGAQAGPSSTPAKVIGIAALGVTGLLDWPLVAAVGAGVLVADRINRRNGQEDVDDEPDVLELPAEVPPVDSRRPTAAELAEEPGDEPGDSEDQDEPTPATAATPIVRPKPIKAPPRKTTRRRGAGG